MNNLKLQIENRLKKRKAQLESLKEESINVEYGNVDNFLRLSEKKARLESVIETLEEVICDIELKLQENN